ncbi:hypothetical protein [Deinococcus cellulosilyticus]|nr:hypothetical protein [Deinococcus cellulosilyticus]
MWDILWKEKACRDQLVSPKHLIELAAQEQDAVIEFQEVLAYLNSSAFMEEPLPEARPAKEQQGAMAQSVGLRQKEEAFWRNQATALDHLLAEEYRKKLHAYTKKAKSGFYWPDIIREIRELKSDPVRWNNLNLNTQVEFLTFLALQVLNAGTMQARDEATALRADILHLDGTANVKLLDAALLRADHRTEEALATLTGEGSEAAALQRAVCLFDLRRYEEAHRELDHIELPELKVDVHRLKALVFLHQHDLDAALLYINQGLELERNNQKVRHVHALILYYSAVHQRHLPGEANWPMPLQWEMIKQDPESQANLLQAHQLFKELSQQDITPAFKNTYNMWMLATLACQKGKRKEAVDFFLSLKETASLTPEMYLWALVRNWPVIEDSDLDDLEKHPSPNGKVVVVRYLLHAERFEEARDKLQAYQPYLIDLGETAVLLDLWMSLAGESNHPEWIDELIPDFGGWDAHPNLRVVYIQHFSGTPEELLQVSERLYALYQQEGDVLDYLEAFHLRMQLKEWTWCLEHGETLIQQAHMQTAFFVAIEAAMTAHKWDTAWAWFQKFENEPWVLDNQYLNHLRMEVQIRVGLMIKATANAERVAFRTGTPEALWNLALLYRNVHDISNFTRVVKSILRDHTPSVPEVLHMLQEVRPYEPILARQMIEHCMKVPLGNPELLQVCYQAQQIGLDLPKPIEKRLIMILKSQDPASEEEQQAEEKRSEVLWDMYNRGQLSLYHLGRGMKYYFLPELAMRFETRVEFGQYTPLYLFRGDRVPVQKVKNRSSELGQVKELRLDNMSLSLLMHLGCFHDVAKTFTVRVSRFHSQVLHDLMVKDFHVLDLHQYPRLKDITLHLQGFIRDQLQEGHLTYLTEPEELPEDPEGLGNHLLGLWHLTTATHPESRAVVADRWSQGFQADTLKQPIFDVLDILHQLVERKVWKPERMYEALQHLRKARLRFIPVTPDELLYHLNQADIEGRILRETPGLKLLRQYYSEVFHGSTHFVPIQAADGKVEFHEVQFAIQHHHHVHKAITGAFFHESQDETALLKARWLYRVLHVPLYAIFQQSWTNLPVGAVNKPNLEASEIESYFTTIGTQGAQRRNRLYGRWYERETLMVRLREKPELARFFAERHSKAISESLETLSTPEEQLKHIQFFQEVQTMLPRKVQQELIKIPAYNRILGQVQYVDFGGNFQFEERELIHAFKKAAWSPSKDARLKRFDPEAKKTWFRVTRQFESIPIASDERVFWLVNEKNIREHKQVQFPDVALLSDDPKDVREYLKGHPALLEQPEAQREPTVRKLLGIKDPNKRWTAFEHLKENTSFTYYTHLFHILEASKVLVKSHVNWLPKQPVTILHYMRLEALLDHPATPELYAEAAAQLCNQRNVLHALETISSLPVPLPDNLTERFLALPQAEQDITARKWASNFAGPLTVMHSYRFLSRLAQPSARVQQLLRILQWRLTRPGFQEEVDVFQQVLLWITREIQGSTRAWSNQAILAALWSHAHRVYVQLRRVGFSLNDIRDLASEAEVPMLGNTLTRKNSLNNDWAWPGRTNPNMLYVTFLKHALPAHVTRQLNQVDLDRVFFESESSDEGVPLLQSWWLLLEIPQHDAMASILPTSQQQIFEAFFKQAEEDSATTYDAFDQQALFTKDTWSWWDWLLVRQTQEEEFDDLQSQKVLQEFKKLQLEEISEENIESALTGLAVVSHLMVYCQDFEQQKKILQDTLITLIKRASKINWVTSFEYIEETCVALCRTPAEATVDMTVFAETLYGVCIDQQALLPLLLGRISQICNTHGADTPSAVWDMKLSVLWRMERYDVDLRDAFLLMPEKIIPALKEEEEQLLERENQGEASNETDAPPEGT